MSGVDLARDVRGRLYRVRLNVKPDDARELVESLEVKLHPRRKPHRHVEFIGRRNHLLVVVLRFTNYDWDEAGSLWSTRELV